MRKTLHLLGGLSALLLLGSTAFANPAAASHPSAPITMRAASGMMAKLTGNKTSPMSKMKNGAASAMKSVNGPVKGAVSGKTFVIGTRGGPVTVDASKATVRDNGKFASISGIKGGVMVTAVGTMMGKMLMASTVTIHSRGGKSGAMKGGSMKGGKMTPKMTPKKK